MISLQMIYFENVAKTCVVGSCNLEHQETLQHNNRTITQNHILYFEFKIKCCLLYVFLLIRNQGSERFHNNLLQQCQTNLSFQRKSFGIVYWVCLICTNSENGRRVRLGIYV